LAPNDPSHVLSALGAKYVTAYQGFRDYPLVKSPWENWKPAHKSGWNVQVVWTPLTNPSTTYGLKGLQDELKASGKVATVQVQAPAAVTDVPQQLQMIQTAIQRKPDLLVIWPLAPEAAVPLIAQAAKAGIPTVSNLTSTPSKYAVSVNISFYLSEGLTAAGVLHLMGGKGNVLAVHGIQGVASDADASAAWAQALSRCPNVHLAGTVWGQFATPVAKAQVQQFLATHPAGVQGVFDVGVMGPGILGAFEQTGRTPPPLADPGSSQGTIAYWHAHPDYNMVAQLSPDYEVGQGSGMVALRMLGGEGVKINTILGQNTYVVTRNNLGQVWKPSFQEGSPLDATPPLGLFLPKAYLDGFFTHPSTQ
jgi:ribose transport system substrate-binding protein